MVLSKRSKKCQIIEYAKFLEQETRTWKNSNFSIRNLFVRISPFNKLSGRGRNTHVDLLPYFIIFGNIIPIYSVAITTTFSNALFLGENTIFYNLCHRLWLILWVTHRQKSQYLKLIPLFINFRTQKLLGSMLKSYPYLENTGKIQGLRRRLSGLWLIFLSTFFLKNAFFKRWYKQRFFFSKCIF